MVGLCHQNPQDRLITTTEEVADGAFHLFWSDGLATVPSAVCTILIARLLGPELYGMYSLALIVSGFLTIFTDYGVNQALTRFVALYRCRGEQSRIIPLLRVGLSFSFYDNKIITTGEGGMCLTNYEELAEN